MIIKGPGKYKEILGLMPEIYSASIKGLQRDLQEYDYDVIKIKRKLRMFSEMISVLQGKWTIEICFILLIHGEYSYNEIKSLLPKISTRTFTDRLRQLEKKGIVKRKIISLKTIRVYYQLTQFGKQQLIFLVPALLNFALPFSIRKDLPKIRPLKDSFQREMIKDKDNVLEILEK